MSRTIRRQQKGAPARNGSREKQGNQRVHKRRHGSNAKRKRKDSPKELAPIRVSKSSIHSHWKKELGGIIRYYVNKRSEQNVNSKEAEQEIERMYYKSGCSIIETKDAILGALGVTKEVQENWVDLFMAVEKEGILPDASTNCMSETVDSKGLKLHMELKSGEGPAHAHEHWTNVIVPDWAVGKSYFFQVENNSAIDLSCEMYIDEHKVARNAPLPKLSKRTVKPDSSRYFERHKWVLQPANRVKLDAKVSVAREGPNSTRTSSEGGRVGKRYNGIRPNYHDKRVEISQYPDPTSCGWTFTGSVEESCVEFFERRENMGVMKLDFYYTTATVKTVLDHPTTGMNQLFRNTVSPEEYIKILQNPRIHTGRGYRRRMDRGEDRDVNMNDDDFESGASNGDGNNDAEMKESDTNETAGVSETTYFAKNDGYNFKTDGHFNRRIEMEKMQRDAQFLAWEEAARKEYAFIHAKFYISLPKNMRRGQISNGRSRPRRRGARNKNKEALPEQAPVVDLKATETIGLGTKFHSLGPSGRSSGRRSNVKMSRIKGLTDDEDWKGAPLFECKIYYRAERSTEDEEMDDDPNDNDNDNVVDVLRQSSSLQEYKTEKIDQVKQLYVESKADPEEAELTLRSCQNKIMFAENFEDIDDLVKIYHDDLIKQKFDATLAGKEPRETDHV